MIEPDATTSWLKLPQITENETSQNGYGPPPSWMNPIIRHLSTPRLRHPRTSDEERCSSRDTLASVPNECFICAVWKIASSGSVSTAKSGGITVLRSCREAAQAQTPDSALPCEDVCQAHGVHTSDSQCKRRRKPRMEVAALPRPAGATEHRRDNFPMICLVKSGCDLSSEIAVSN